MATARSSRQAPRRSLLGRRFPAFGPLLFALATLQIVAMAQAQSNPDEPAAATGPETPIVQEIDPALVELQQQLGELLAGNLRDSIEVPTLFGVPLDDHSAVKSRIEELALEVEESKTRVAEMQDQLVAIAAQREAEVPPDETAAVAEPDLAPDEAPAAENLAPLELPLETEAAGLDPIAREEHLQAAREAHASRLADNDRRAREIEAQLASATLRLDVATKRLRYLRLLEKRLGRMTDASRRVLPSLSSPRSALRSHAALLTELNASLNALVGRLELLSQRSESGMLVGFVSEQKALAADLSAAAASYRQQTRQLDRLSSELLELASALEAEGLEVRRNFFRAPGLDHGGALDELFLRHLQSQRRLRKTVSDVLTAPGQGTLEELRGLAQKISPAPLRVGTTSDAQRVLEAGVEHRQRIESLLAAERAGTHAWELAFENELVAVCADMASPNARASAYHFSSEVLTDVRSEIEIAWMRIAEGIEARRARVPTLRALLTTPVGQGYLLRAAGILAVVVTWLLLRRKTPRLTVLAVKALAMLKALRGRVGLLVRWSGLLQAILPAAFALVALHVVLSFVGEDAPSAQVLRAVLLPLLLYFLGRQALFGVTRRITPGRPALIELRPSTLHRLQRTYATLGIVVALAYIVDGVARNVIGSGRLVALLEGTVLFWVVLWAIWATIQWRPHLAEYWATLVPDDEPPPIERRLAQWMKGSRLGLVLSPVAAMRIVATPVVNLVTGFATETDFVQSLRARLLRHRSKQSETVVEATAQTLPGEYLAAFPLNPILGEDDSLLVPREGVLAEVTDQWNRWKETRTDGSLVLIGEKGVGKTTLAAQIGRRLKEADLVLHTVHGKPTQRDAILRDLAEACGARETRDLEELIQLLCDGPERVVLVDEAHNVFLRHIDGYGAYDALVELVNATSSKVFWVLIFNSFTWRFLNESRGRVRYFRKLLHLPKWTPEEIQQLIRLRHKKTGFDLHFDEMLLSDEKAASGGLELVEEAEGYFRLLWESSSGNPRIASRLWLSSLRLVSERSLAVGLFREAETGVLSTLQDDLVFSLAAICQHENLSGDELARVLNVSEGFARFAVQFLSESGFLEPKDTNGERYTLAPTYYRAVLRALKSKHLIYD